MIIDDIEHIAKYKSVISEEVIEFVKSLNINIKNGRYEINKNDYANIEEYITEKTDLSKFEAHKKYADIQILLSGEEYLDIINTEKLKVFENYNDERDIMFLEPNEGYDRIKLVPSKFVLIYPHEAHRPQVKINSCSVKKVVVKISV